MGNLAGDSTTAVAAVSGDNGGAGPGVWGASQDGEGVHGETSSKTFAAVAGASKNSGPGVWGVSQGGEGVHGETSSMTFAGSAGINTSGGPGVWGASQDGEGVHGETNSAVLAAVAGINKNPNATGAGVYGKGRVAGFFEGDVTVRRNLTVDGDVILANADIAEDFSVAGDDCRAGLVLCVDDEEDLRPCTKRYDKRVVGVVSGAGALRPGIVLGRTGESSTHRVPVALTGRVYCMVDATSAPIQPGDLLTTSEIVGHAMRADPRRAPGAVLGKALKSLTKGRGLIPILVTLQ